MSPSMWTSPGGVLTQDSAPATGPMEVDTNLGPGWEEGVEKPYYNPRLDPKNYLDGPLSTNPATRLRQLLARPGIIVNHIYFC